MKIVVTLRELFDNCSSWDDVCSVKHYDPYIMQRVSGTEEVYLTPEQAVRFGIVGGDEQKVEIPIDADPEISFFLPFTNDGEEDSEKKDRIVAVLEKLRKLQVCAYRVPESKGCDCKYGGTKINGEGKYADEYNGCPELRVAIELIENLSYPEFLSILSRRKNQW